MNRPVTRQEGLARARRDVEPRPDPSESAGNDAHDPNSVPPRADQFQITDPQLWIDLSA